METLIELFGRGTCLTVLQMSLRAAVIGAVCLLLIRFAGSRTFGMKMPLDNVLTILLGAILSRAVVGASPFFATICAAATIVVLHRLCAWLGLYSKFVGKIVKGEEKILFENGQLNDKNMKHCSITEKDIIEGVRLNSNLDSLEKVKTIYAERSGEISVVKKDN